MKNLEKVKKSDKLILDSKKKTIVYRINIFLFLFIDYLKKWEYWR